MDIFKLELFEGIAVVKVDIPSATLREAKSLWDIFESEQIFDWRKIIIDLSECTFVDSTFIGMIIKIYRRVNETNSQLKLVFPQLNNTESFRVVGITKIMQCFKNIDHAVKSYSLNSSVPKIKFDERNLVQSVLT